jgi:hypothetical protein
VIITWKRKGPKGCYRTVHEGRIVLLERAKAPYENLWLMHEPDGAGGLSSHTLFAKTSDGAQRTATALLLRQKPGTAKLLGVP